MTWCEKLVWQGDLRVWKHNLCYICLRLAFPSWAWHASKTAEPEPPAGTHNIRPHRNIEMGQGDNDQATHSTDRRHPLPRPRGGRRAEPEWQERALEFLLTVSNWPQRWSVHPIKITAYNKPTRKKMRHKQDTLQVSGRLKGSNEGKGNHNVEHTGVGTAKEGL